MTAAGSTGASERVAASPTDEPETVDVLALRPSDEVLEQLDLEFFSTTEVGAGMRLDDDEQVIEHRYVTTGASPEGRQPDRAVVVRLITLDRLVAATGRLERTVDGPDAERSLERRRIGDHEGWVLRSIEDDTSPGSGYEEVGFVVEGIGAVSVVNLVGASIDDLLAVAESMR